MRRCTFQAHTAFRSRIFPRRARDLLPDLDEDVIVYCGGFTCPVAQQATELLHESDCSESLAGTFDSMDQLSRKETSRDLFASGRILSGPWG